METYKMSGKFSRNKGKRGERQAKDLLLSRDWIVSDLSDGLSNGDFLANDTNGNLYSVEVKFTVDICQKHRKQAQEQAKKRRANWMLMSHIPDTSAWLIQRQGHNPVVWSKS